MRQKTFKELITELADNPFKYKHTNSSNIENRYIFYDELGELYEVFIIKSGTKINVEFTKNGNYGIDQSNNPFRVFATVYAVLKGYMDTNEVKTLVFDANKEQESRVNLYKKFAERLKEEFKFNTLSFKQEKYSIEIMLKK